jgi:hypothetical protein
MRGIGRCGSDGMIGCTKCQPEEADPVPPELVPVEPVEVDPGDEAPAVPVPGPVDPEPVACPLVPVVPPGPAAPVEPAPDDPEPVLVLPPLPLVPATVPAVTRFPDAGWCTGRMTATATAAADTRLPAMAAVLANALMSDLLLLRPRRLMAVAGEFVTPVGVLSTEIANNFSAGVPAAPRSSAGAPTASV